MKGKMLLLFELDKELKDEYTYGGNKNIKQPARRIYKSFERLYLLMPYNKK